jgi:tetratricopeptide (TPR) repeat protein
MFGPPGPSVTSRDAHKKPMIRSPARSVHARASLPDVYPLEIAPTEPAGRVFFRELRAIEAVYVLKAFRVTMAWCRQAVEPVHGGLQRFAWRREFTAFPLDQDLWYPLIVLSEQLAREQVNARTVANACLALGDWAIGRGARHTALLFGEAAAAAAPDNPRYAYVVGRLFRRWEMYGEAEHWLTRAGHVGVRTNDKYVQTLALNSLANLRRKTGDYPTSRAFLLRARQMARRYRFRELEGEILHDLSLLSTFMRRFAEADRYGILALERYRPKHPNLTKLRHDLALIWAEQGSFERAIAVFASLLPTFTTPEERLRSLAALVHCTAGAGERSQFERYWAEAWTIANNPAVETVLASTLLDMARGAAALREWPRAEAAASWALRRAEDAGEEDALASAKAVLETIRKGQA